MNILTSTADYNRLNDQYGYLFEQNCFPSFSNLLWQIIVNERFKDKVVVFTPVYDSNGLTIGIAHMDEEGYQPTHVYFKKNVSYDDAMDGLHFIGEELFGLTAKAQVMVVFTSMRKPAKLMQTVDEENNDENPLSEYTT